MDLSRTRALNNRQNFQANMADSNSMLVQLPDDPPPPPKPKGPCFHCGKMGHFIRNCHSRTGTTAYANTAYQQPPPSTYLDSTISYMDMRSVAPPTLTPRANITSLKAQIDSLSLTDNNSLIEMMGVLQDFTPT
jgi:hypothetical protein